MNEFEDGTLEEQDQENLEFLQQLRGLYLPRASMEQRLLGVQHRLHSRIEGHLSEDIQEDEIQHRPHKGAQTTKSTDIPFPQTKRLLWQRRLGTLAAGLCAALLVGGLLVVLNLAHHNSQPGSRSSQPVPARQDAPLATLHMIDASTGWDLNSGKLMRTTDGGAHWNDVTPRGILLTPGSTSTALSASLAWLAVPTAVNPLADTTPPPGTRIFRTIDGGQSWQSSVVPVIPGNLKIAQITFATAQNGWLLYNQGGVGGAERATVVRTTDGGKTWAVVSTVLPASTDAPPPGRLPFGGTKTGITFLNASTGWITGSDSVPNLSWLFVTHNGGQTWTQQHLALPPGVSPASLSLLPPTFFSTTDGILPVDVGQANTIIYVTHDEGATWQPTTPVSANLIASDFFDEQHGWVTDGTSLLTTGDGGHTWVRQPANPTFTHVTQLDFVSSTHGWAVRSGGSLLQTMDGGRTWA
jgi:photosystem II stability/assembly factor-like uncharacterized protein